MSTRPGAGGGKVHYLAAEKVINLANEVFGFNGWSSQIQNVQIDFVDEHAQTGKISLGLSTIVRVTLRDGTFHEDIGYGHIENCKGKAAAFEKAKKEAATDAMKRALRNFGNVLGNCLYDKDYLQRIQKIKVAPSKWDAENLHRHPDYAPIKRESIADVEAQQQKSAAAQRQSSAQSGASFGSMEFDDDFGGNPFDEADFSHPDEVLLEGTVNGIETPAKKAINGPPRGGAQRQGVQRMQSMPQMRPPNVQQPAPLQTPQQLPRPQGPQRPANNPAQAPQTHMPPPQSAHNQQRTGPLAVAPHTNSDNPGSRSNPSSATVTESPVTHAQSQRQPNGRLLGQTDGTEQEDPEMHAPRMPPPGVPDGFVTGRSVDLLNQPPGSRPPNAAIAFNPHAETPSIRRTQGVNPGKSAPVSRQALNSTSAPTGQHNPHGGAPAAQQPQQSPANGNGNGMNGATTPVRTNFVNPSADLNRRIGMPPSAAAHTVQNRSAYKPPSVNPMKRPPLTDVSNIQQMDGAGDAKKPKLDHPVAQSDTENVAAAAPDGAT